MATELGYIHHFEPGADPTLPPVLLLHGTGGDEATSCRLAARSRRARRSSRRAGMCSRAICPASSGAFAKVCSTRRMCGVERANSLNFVAEARRAYGLAQPLALGYSNGANIAAAVLLLHPETLAGAILLRAMAPLSDPPKPDLTGVPVLILSGLNDPIAPRSSAEKLATALAAAGARIEREDLPAGHGLTPDDVRGPRRFTRAKQRIRKARSGACEPGTRSETLGRVRRHSFLATKATMSVITDDAA